MVYVLAYHLHFRSFGRQINCEAVKKNVLSIRFLLGKSQRTSCKSLLHKPPSKLRTRDELRRRTSCGGNYEWEGTSRSLKNYLIPSVSLNMSFNFNVFQVTTTSPREKSTTDRDPQI